MERAASSSISSLVFLMFVTVPTEIPYFSAMLRTVSLASISLSTSRRRSSRAQPEVSEIPAPCASTFLENSIGKFDFEVLEYKMK